MKEILSWMIIPFSVVKIAWKSVMHRRFAAFMTMCSMGLGVMLIVTVLTMFGVVSDSFKSNSSLGYDMLVGAKGGKLQLTLNSVFYLSDPIETIPYEYYLEFYGSDVRTPELKNSIAFRAHEANWQDYELAAVPLIGGPAGLMNDMIQSSIKRQALVDLKIEPDNWTGSKSKFNGRFDSLADLAIPINLGDYFHEYRVVATQPTFFEELVVKYDSRPVRNWEHALHYFVAPEWEDYQWESFIDSILQQDVEFSTKSLSAGNLEVLKKIKKADLEASFFDELKYFCVENGENSEQRIAQFHDTIETWPEMFEHFGDAESVESFVSEITSSSDWSEVMDVANRVLAVQSSKEWSDYSEHISEADSPLKKRDKQIILARLFTSPQWESLVKSYFENIRYKVRINIEEPFKFSDGRAFETNHSENGFYECVVGSVVAAARDVKVGDFINPRHGAPDGHDHDQGFKVVGILAPTGSPNDRVVFANLEGFYLMEDHAKPIGDKGVQEMDKDDPTRGKTITKEALKKEPLPVEQREITAILVRSDDEYGMGSLMMADPINEGLLRSSLNWSPYQPSKNVKQDAAQAVSPTEEIVVLLDMFVRPMQYALLFLTCMICLVSGISILVSIYNSMAERRHEIAVMRSLGASRILVLSIILCESIIIAICGGLLGWIGGHALNQAISPYVEKNTGVQLSFFEFAPPATIFPDRLWGFDFPNEALESISPELLLIPGLIMLAILVGLYPAISAYFTDVSKSLGK